MHYIITDDLEYIETISNAKIIPRYKAMQFKS